MNCVNREVGLGSALIPNHTQSLPPPPTPPPSLINRTVFVDEKHHERKERE